MKKFTRLILLAAAFAAPDLMAQQAVTSSGGEATGSGGSASFSTGQIAYETISGPGGTATLGVQQPYEIFVLGQDEHPSVSLHAIVYPNPTVATIALRIEMVASSDFRYELYDLNGRLLQRDKARVMETIISMEQYPAATYILKVYAGKSELKSFKILKNTI